MHILVLSANTGGGHNSVAAALSEEMDRRGVTCDIKDCLVFLSERVSDLISWGHSYIYRRLPHLFGKAYDFEEKHPNQQIYDIMSLGVEKFFHYMEEHPYDAVICTHVFAGMMVTETKRRFRFSVPFYFVATDYTCSPGVGDISPERWFIPDATLTDEFVAGGVPADRQLVTGIPVRRCFFDRVSRKEARAALSLPADKQMVLLCCGSMGCGRMERIAPQLESSLPEDAMLVIICGRNEQTYERLREAVTERTIVIGFTDQIALYMAAADICITKPGGLTVTELMTLGLPSVLMLAVPGCETHNLDYLCARSLAIGTTDWDEAIFQTAQLLGDRPRLAAMRDRLVALDMPDAATEIVSYIQNAHASVK